MNTNIHNTLIFTPPHTNCTSNRREVFLFVFNSFASLCHKVVAVFVFWRGNKFGELALFVGVKR